MDNIWRRGKGTYFREQEKTQLRELVMRSTGLNISGSLNPVVVLTRLFFRISVKFLNTDAWILHPEMKKYTWTRAKALRFPRPWKAVKIS